MLRATHLSQRLTACPWKDIDPGWFVRFTGDGDEWDDLREELKDLGWDCARWIPAYAWDDGKRGAWWIDADVFREGIVHRFTNVRYSMLAATDETVQWMYKGRYSGWVGSDPPREYPKHEPSVPAFLLADYRVLELPEKATLKDVKDAYRRLSKVYHPDTGGTHHGFIALQAAYTRIATYIEARERVAG